MVTGTAELRRWLPGRPVGEEERATFYFEIELVGPSELLKQEQTKVERKDRWATKCMNMSLYAAKLIMRPERATEEQFDPCLAQTDCRYDGARRLDSG